MNLKATLKSIKLHESTISMILGAVIIVVVGALLVNYFAKKPGETIPPIEIGDESKIPSTHTVAEGEDLWSISEKYFGTGYNWVDIAQANNIEDPNQIEAGQVLTIPSVAPRIAEAQISPPTPTEEVQVTIQPKDLGKYTVSEDDNLWKIAESYFKSGYNWVDIAQANNLADPNQIEIGQELVIPSVEAKVATVIEASAESEPISGATYTVVEGDNLWDIAVRAYGDGYRWVDVAKDNNLENPNIIHTGNTLSLPR